MNSVLTSMRLAVLGAGKQGRVIGHRLALAGNSVRFGVRGLHSANAAQVLHKHWDNVEVDTIASAISYGDVIVFAVPSEACVELVLRHSRLLVGKIIVDATGLEEGGWNTMNAIQQQIKNVRAFRAFSNISSEVLDRSNFLTIPDLFYCGSDDQDAVNVLNLLIEQLGFRPIRLGGLSEVPLLDSLAKVRTILVEQLHFSSSITLKALS